MNLLPNYFSNFIKITLLAIAILISLTLTTYSQATGKIAGKISDNNGIVLSGANVYIEKLSKGAVTNQEGNFNIFNIPSGSYKLKVTYIGYQPQEIDVNIDANRTQYVEVQLNPGVIQGNEVIALGERLDGQAKALNQQRTNNNITNVVSTDQIGRFPDQNIGDAMKRIPAITVNYDQGEARFINIRGTEPRLNSVMIDGDRVPSAEAEARNVQVDLIPSDMVQTIEVNKSITPDMDGDAIGGAVNLVTRSAPLGLRISGTLGSGINMLSEKPIWNGGLIIGNRLFDNKLGIILSGSLYDHHLGSDNIEGEWKDTSNQIIHFDSGVIVDDLLYLCTLKLPQIGSVLELVHTYSVDFPGQGIAWDKFEKDYLYGINKKENQVIKVKLITQ